MRLDPTLIALCAATLLGLVGLAGRLAPVPVPVPVPTEAGEAAGGCRPGYVHDGDTMELVCAASEGAGRGRAERRARLIGIDTPEMAGECAEEIRAAHAARSALIGLIAAAAEIRVEARGRDRYGRVLVRLWLDGRDASESLIALGHGRPYDGGARMGWCG
ncbi:thermonuclease family protein [Pseudogemmobacter sonorensis]|uniref:thermonuclease family protein n=1 Tax=Pseudogemmobacter sonorensis TaxID=2989681 RepID=UPI0036A0F68F